MQRKVFAKKDTLYQQCFAQEKIREDYLELTRKSSNQRELGQPNSNWPAFIPMQSFHVTPEKVRRNTIVSKRLARKLTLRKARTQGQGKVVRRFRCGAPRGSGY